MAQLLLRIPMLPYTCEQLRSSERIVQVPDVLHCRSVQCIVTAVLTCLFVLISGLMPAVLMTQSVQDPTHGKLPAVQ